MIISTCKSKLLNSSCPAEKVISRRNIHIYMSLCVCVRACLRSTWKKKSKILFDSKLPRTPATDVTTIILNKPQAIFLSKMQLPFLVPPEMWYFSSKQMILRISQGMLRGNGRCYNENRFLNLSLVRNPISNLSLAMVRQHLLSDFFACHQRRKNFPYYSLTKENIFLSHFWTRMVFFHSILNLVLCIKAYGSVLQAWKSF